MQPHGGELFRLWPEWDAQAGRRNNAALKRRLYVGNYRAEISRLIQQRIADDKSRAEVLKFVSTAHGLFGAVADTCAVVYQRGVKRWLRDASPEVSRAFTTLVTESRLPARGNDLNATAWAVGPVVALPYVSPDVRGVQRLRVYLATADRYCVRRADNGNSSDEFDAVLYQRDDKTFVEVDAKEWRYWDEQGNRLEGGKYDAPHTLGYCPAAALRARPELPYDWSGSNDHTGLADAALEIGFMYAAGRWTRTQNSAPLTVIKSPEEKYAKGQAIGHPSQPLVFDGNRNESEVQVLDRTVDPAKYLSEMQALASAAVARYGIPPSAVSFTNDMTNWGVLSVNVTPGALALQRDRQAPPLRAGEVSLWRIALDVVRTSEHRYADLIPSAEEVEDKLRVSFPDLSDSAEQQRRMDVFEKKLPHGLTSPEEEETMARPEITYDEAREEIEARLAAHIARLEELASRNVTMDAARGAQSIAQLQGRVGGEKSGAARASAAEENDDPS